MRELSLFSGAGGGLLATKHLLGWKTVGYVEIEPYCQEVLKARIADGYLDPAPIFSDIRKFISDGYAEAYQGMVDVITGGFPCQDISCAGRGVGIAGEQSGLWGSMASVIGRVRPKFVFVENSPALISRGIEVVLQNLSEMGFDAQWGCIGSHEAGFPHKRIRIWVVANSKGARQLRTHKLENGEKYNGERWRLHFAKVLDIPQQRQNEQTCRYSAEPALLGRNNGVPFRMDRIRAIGNGQVPIVAATAWKILSGQ